MQYTFDVAKVATCLGLQETFFQTVPSLKGTPSFMLNNLSGITSSRPLSQTEAVSVHLQKGWPQSVPN